MDIKKRNEKNIKDVELCLNEIIKGFPNHIEENKTMQFGVQHIHHYTSFEKLFSILDNDSFWASRSRFSNDSTEEKLVGDDLLKKTQYYGDNYILCFSRDGDVLSQWRGYCPKGGASIEFELPEGSSTYTLLHSDYSISNPSNDKVELYENRPLPVIYCRTRGSKSKGIETDKVINLFNEPKFKKIGVKRDDILPYLKNGYFYEENELRLVFNNSNRELENCIQFRKLEDGSMIPYIVVKYGNLQQMGRDLSITYDKKHIEEVFEKKQKDTSSSTIVVPCGRNQSEICSEFSKKIREYKMGIYKDDSKVREQRKWEKHPIKVICDGHLPVVSITISPSQNQEYMKEVVERFCRSKYWLQNVEVKTSKIPYIAPKI